MADISELEDLELYAWVGWDELGSGEIGLKQAICPAGIIPMVAIERGAIEKYWEQGEAQAARYGKKVFLVRLQVVEVVRETKEGEIG